jgi:pyrroline-5-carboxylate reductase
MKLGVIGCGKMGSALVRGVLGSGACDPADVYLFDAVEEAAESLAAVVDGVVVGEGVADVAEEAEVVVVCVKPGDVAAVLAELAEIENEPVFVSVAAGVRLRDLERGLGDGRRVVRVMPNTPALVGKGASAVALGSWATEEDAELVEGLFGEVGRVYRVDEKLMDAVTGLSGSGPAFVFTVIEALADGGVLTGLPREVALGLAAQTVAGAAEMVLQTGEHPGVLRDQVASPGGTTIAGLAAMEEAGLRSGLIAAVRAAAARSAELAEGR